MTPEQQQQMANYLAKNTKTTEIKVMKTGNDAVVITNALDGNGKCLTSTSVPQAIYEKRLSDAEAANATQRAAYEAAKTAAGIVTPTPAS